MKMPICLWQSNRPLCLLAISHKVQLCGNMDTSECDAYTLGITPFVPPQAAAADLQQALLPGYLFN